MCASDYIFLHHHSGGLGVSLVTSMYIESGDSGELIISVLLPMGGFDCSLVLIVCYITVACLRVFFLEW